MWLNALTAIEDLPQRLLPPVTLPRAEDPIALAVDDDQRPALQPRVGVELELLRPRVDDQPLGPPPVPYDGRDFADQPPDRERPGNDRERVELAVSEQLQLVGVRLPRLNGLHRPAGPQPAGKGFGVRLPYDPLELDRVRVVHRKHLLQFPGRTQMTATSSA